MAVECWVEVEADELKTAGTVVVVASREGPGFGVCESELLGVPVTGGSLDTCGFDTSAFILMRSA